MEELEKDLEHKKLQWEEQYRQDKLKMQIEWEQDKKKFLSSKADKMEWQLTDHDNSHRDMVAYKDELNEEIWRVNKRIHNTEYDEIRFEGREKLLRAWKEQKRKLYSKLYDVEVALNNRESLLRGSRRKFKFLESKEKYLAEFMGEDVNYQYDNIDSFLMEDD